jgi:uncharacterized protein YbjT (DUF2867 family)
LASNLVRASFTCAQLVVTPIDQALRRRERALSEARKTKTGLAAGHAEWVIALDFSSSIWRTTRWQYLGQEVCAMFVVLGASGNTGRIVAQTLLAQKKKVRVVVRDVARGQAWKEAGAEVSVAELEDSAALKHAFSDTEGAYVLLPPNFSSTEVLADNHRRTRTLAAALEAAGVPHVVLLSSIGAQQTKGTGPVLGVHDAEAAFSRGSAAATFVRAAYFMENWGGALFGIAEGVLPSFLLADKAIPMVATRDIGVAAARLLVEGGSGKRVIELAGPREYSPRDVAAALARVVGKPIALQEAPEDAMEPALAAAGMNAEWIRLFKELTHGLNTGIVVWEGGHPLWRGETDIQTVLSALLAK